MSFKIMPGEFHVLTDRFVIRTRVPAAEITDDMVLQRVVASNLAPGDMVTVQVTDHTYETLLAEAEYRVIGRTEAMERLNIDERNERMENRATYRIARKGGWWKPATEAAETKKAA